MVNETFSVIYYQTLKEAFWPLRLERRRVKNNFKKMKKFTRFVKKSAKISDFKKLQDSINLRF